MTERHYLQREFEELMRDPATLAFLDEGALDGLWYWDLEAPEHEWMSPGFWRTLGFDPADRQHLAAEWQDLIFPEDRDVALQNFQAHLADPGHPYDQLVRYRTADGGTVTVRCRGLAIRQDGEAKRMLGAHTVVHDTRKHELERQLSELLELSDDAVLAWSERDGVKRWNRGAALMYGVERHAAAGRDPNALTGASYPEGWPAALASLERTGQWAGDVVRAGPGGRLVTSSRYQRLEVTDGEPLILQIDRDVTEARRHEQQAELALEAGRMGTFDWNPQTGALEADERDHALFGAPPGTLTSGDDFFARVHPDDADGVTREVERVLSGQAPIYDTEFRVVLPDGAPRWLAVRGQVAARDDEGRPVSVRGVNWDVTEQQHAAAQLGILNRELNHRMKNMFSVVQGIVAMSAREEADAATLSRTIRDRVSALAASHLVSMGDEDQAATPLRELASAVLSPHATQGDRLTLTGDDVVVPRRAVTPLGLILHELATNAVKYGAWASADGTVTIRTRQEARGEAAAPWLVLDWRESCLAQGAGGARRPPEHEGFGTRLIAMSMQQLGGSTQREWTEGGLHATLALPLSATVGGEVP